MGIKDRVINILFDEDELRRSSNTTKLSRRKHDNSSNVSDTSPIFIDANSPSKVNHRKVEDKKNDDINDIVVELKQEEVYHMTENISPIFGPQRNETKSKKTNQRIKNDGNTRMYEGLLNAGTNAPYSQYSSVIISPIYGPLENKPTRKNPVKAHKKQADPFRRSIDDTGEFKTMYVDNQNNEEEELDFEHEAPLFDGVKEDVKQEEDKLGDTDRLSKISDRINQIKNEAAHIYSENKEHIESRVEAAKESRNSISDLIHNFQKEDFTSSMSELNKNVDVLPEVPLVEYTDTPEDNIEENEDADTTKPQELVDDASSYEDSASVIQEDTFELESQPKEEKGLDLDETFDQINEKLDDVTSSADDILKDSSDEEKDLFSDLFGDE